jgi:hypothetical protein
VIVVTLEGWLLITFQRPDSQTFQIGYFSDGQGLFEYNSAYKET